MHIAKKGLRILGIAESFSSGKNSILAGVVMRKDLRIDGFSFTTTTVGGMDATDSVIDSLPEFYERRYQPHHDQWRGYFPVQYYRPVPCL